METRSLPDKVVSPVTPSSPVGALIMGGDYRGLALVRGLGRMEVRVWVFHQVDERLAEVSRYTERVLFHANWQDEKGVEFLLRVARDFALNGWALFPTTDDSVRL